MSEDKTLTDKTAVAKAASFGLNVVIGAAVAALVLGIVLGKFLLGGSSAGSASGSYAGKVAVTEAELDNTLATYTYKGKTETITARDVIMQNGTLESAVDAEGNYRVPSADNVLTVARNRILEDEANTRGLTVSDEELAEFSEQTLGTSDYESIASTYSMEQDAVISLLKTSALMAKLRDDVVDTTSMLPAPESPATPEPTTETRVNEETGEEEEVTVDNYDVATKEYADYIISLAGDEWDSEAGTWAAPDGPYATALADYEITAESATYDAATSAYYVAYQLYSQSQTSASTQWTEFVNGLLSEATITLGSLVS